MDDGWTKGDLWFNNVHKSSYFGYRSNCLICCNERKKMTLLRWKIVLFAVGLLTSVTSCTVGPDYVRPITGVPVSYKEIDGWKEANLKDDAIKEAWWELFNDPQMNALEEQVIISNQNVWVAEAQFRQARALVQSARAGYFPTLVVGASATRLVASNNLNNWLPMMQPPLPIARSFLPPFRRLRTIWPRFASWGKKYVSKQRPLRQPGRPQL